MPWTRMDGWRRSNRRIGAWVRAFALCGFGLYDWWLDPTLQRLNPACLILSLAAGYGLLWVLVFLHECIHGLVCWLVGARPVLEFDLWRRRFSCSVDGHLFRRGAFLVFALAPTLSVNAVGLGLMTWVPVLRFALVVALAAHLQGCVDDWRVSLLVWRLPAHSRIEDRRDGLAFHVPTGVCRVSEPVFLSE